jgi:hypothetical protein
MPTCGFVRLNSPTHRVHIFKRDVTGLVCLHTQLEQASTEPASASSAQAARPPSKQCQAQARAEYSRLLEELPAVWSAHQRKAS